jgi:hypothetical protein
MAALDRPRWRASPRAIHTRTPRGGVVLDPVAKAYFALNESGEILWKALEGGASAEQLVAALCREFEVDAASAESDVERWIAELGAAELIQRADAAG